MRQDEVNALSVRGIEAKGLRNGLMEENGLSAEATAEVGELLKKSRARGFRG